MDEKEFDSFFKKSLSEMEEVCNKHLEKEELDIDKWGEDLFNIDSLKELNEYLESEENLKKCEPFEKLRQKFISLHDRYKDSFDDLYKGIEEKTCRREYSSGGICMHRGFYSPSHMDFVVRGMNRGRLLKRGKNGKESFEYLFDKENELICVYSYSHRPDLFLPQIELFVKNTDTVQSFQFNRTPGQKGLEYITEVIKENGKIIEYRWAMFNIFTEERIEFNMLQVEKYDYKDDRIQSFHYFEYLPDPKRPFLTHDKFTLFWDENGKIQSVNTEYYPNLDVQKK